MVCIETLLCTQGSALLLEFHLERLKWGLYQNNYPVPDSLTEHVRNTILKALPQDKKNYRFRYLLDIDKTGKYSDTIEMSLMPSSSFKTFSLGLYTQQKKTVSAPWNAKTTQRDLYHAAALWAEKQGLDDAVILNENDDIIETTIFNIFLLKEGILYTPPLSDMPVKGVFRTWVMSHSVFPVIEKSLKREDLLSAEAILLTNALRVIQLGKIISV